MKGKDIAKVGDRYELQSGFIELQRDGFGRVRLACEDMEGLEIDNDRIRVQKAKRCLVDTERPLEQSDWREELR